MARRSGGKKRSMVGRRVTSAWHRVTGEVVRWEPLGSAMTDILVRKDEGGEVWLSSSDVKPIDGRGALPSRKAAIKRAETEQLRQLRKIREDHGRDIHKPWPGMEFGKGHVGQMLDGAISKLEQKRKKRK